VPLSLAGRQFATFFRIEQRKTHFDRNDDTWLSVYRLQVMHAAALLMDHKIGGL